MTTDHDRNLNDIETRIEERLAENPGRVSGGELGDPDSAADPDDLNHEIEDEIDGDAMADDLDDEFDVDMM